MQNISAIVQNFFNLVSRSVDEYVDKDCRHQPNVKSLGAGFSLSVTNFMSESERSSPQRNNAGTRSDQHGLRSDPPNYQPAASINTTNFARVENTELICRPKSNKASRVAVDAFHQHINRNKISLLQSDIEAGFECDKKYKVGAQSMTPFQYAMWQGNGDAMKVLLPHTSRNHIVLAFLNAHDDATSEELVKILPAAREILAALESQADWKYPLAQCANFIERIEARL